MPYQTVDPIVVSSQIIGALQSLVARNLDPLETVAITVATIRAGQALNVIADTAEFGGTVRYFNPDLGQFIQHRLEQIIAGICEAHNARYELNYQAHYPPVVNDVKISNLVASVALKVVEMPSALVSNCQLMADDNNSRRNP